MPAGATFAFEKHKEDQSQIHLESLEGKREEILKIPDSFDDEEEERKLKDEIVELGVSQEVPAAEERKPNELKINVETPVEETESAPIGIKKESVETVSGTPTETESALAKTEPEPVKIELQAKVTPAETNGVNENVESTESADHTERQDIPSGEAEKTTETLKTMGIQILDKLEEYKKCDDDARKKEIANEAAMEVQETEKSLKEQKLNEQMESFDLSELVRSILAKFDLRLMISEEIENIGEKTGKKPSLSPIEELDSSEFGKILCESLGGFDKSMSEGNKLREFLVDFVESLLSLEFTEKNNEQSNYEETKLTA